MFLELRENHVSSIQTCRENRGKISWTSRRRQALGFRYIKWQRYIMTCTLFAKRMDTRPYTQCVSETSTMRSSTVCRRRKNTRTHRIFEMNRYQTEKKSGYHILQVYRSSLRYAFITDKFRRCRVYVTHGLIVPSVDTRYCWSSP